VWDTLLRRRCHPDEVKLFTAREIFLRYRRFLRPAVTNPWSIFDLRCECELEVGQQRVQRGEDDEYRIDEVFTRLAQRLFDTPPRNVDSLVREWIDLEWEHEACVSYPDRHAAHVLSATSNARLVLLSDFYMPGERLGRLVRRIQPRLQVSHVVVSCDVGFNKRSGRLFVQLQQMLKVEPQTHIHVGDNPFSDVEIPRRLGVRALRYENPAEERRRSRLEQRFSTRRSAFDAYWHELMARLEERIRSNSAGGRRGVAARLYRHGLHFAPLYWGFTLFAIEHALQQDVNRVYYFTREGETFFKLHERVVRDNPFGGPLPEPRIIEVSRLATFLPSLRELSPQELMRIWNLYSTQSLGALLRTLDLPVEDFADALRRQGLDAETPIQYPWQHGSVRRFLTDPRIQQRILRERDARRKRLLRYLAQQGIEATTHRIVIADIGWRGTIQDNLAWLLPQTQIVGCYFGLLPLLNEQPPNVLKHAFGPDTRRDPPSISRLLDFVTPLEMLAGPPAGSTVGYHEQNGQVVAIREENPAERMVYERCVCHFQAGVFDAGPIVLDWFRTNAVTTAEMRPHCIELLRELVCLPPRAIARTYFRLVHNETFGVGRYVGRRRRFPWLHAGLGVLSRRWRAQFLQRLEQSTWPQALLKVYYLDPLCWRYNRARDKQIEADGQC